MNHLRKQFHIRLVFLTCVKGYSIFEIIYTEFLNMYLKCFEVGFMTNTILVGEMSINWLKLLNSNIDDISSQNK
jgi:hypothetical protein